MIILLLINVNIVSSVMLLLPVSARFTCFAWLIIKWFRCGDDIPFSMYLTIFLVSSCSISVLLYQVSVNIPSVSVITISVTVCFCPFQCVSVIRQTATLSIIVPILLLLLLLRVLPLLPQLLMLLILLLLLLLPILLLQPLPQHGMSHATMKQFGGLLTLKI